MTTRPAVHVFGVAALAVAIVGVTLAQSGGNSVPGATVTTSLAQGTVVRPGQVVEFTVQSTAPQRDSVSLVLLNPPPGCVFTQDGRAVPPLGGGVGTGRGNVVTATGKVRWLVPWAEGGFRRLTFRAIDHTQPGQTVSASVDLRVDATHEASNTPVQIGDVTGDGVVDSVAGATYANVAGVVDAGAIYVWNGSTAPSGSPDATLVIPGAAAADALGSLRSYGSPPTPHGQGIQLADVTGDGVLDVVAGASAADVAGVADVGAIWVWQGGPTLSGSPAPLATLSASSAVAGAMLGYVSGQGIELADVDGDGQIDVVAGASHATIAGVVDVGAIYVWRGGPTLRGSPAPLARLTVAGATAGDELGIASGQGIQLHDVTGDGLLDVVAGACYADIAGVWNAGAIYVWKGGPTLRGTVAPLARLIVSGPFAGDLLGQASGQAIQLADVTGDGVSDVVAGACLADLFGLVDAGAIYVWKGGPTLLGGLLPFAELTVPGAVSYDHLGNFYGTDQAIQLADVTGDRVVDVVANANHADVAGVSDAGAIYVWRGGATLVGSPAPLATLTVSGAGMSDQLGELPFGAGQGVQLADLTADGVLDVIAGSYLADVAGVQAAGAIYVWGGGSTLRGAPAPLATLSNPAAVASDCLGYAFDQGIQLADVTGDGVVDVIAGAVQADVAGRKDVGAIFVWNGTSTLSGSPAPLATLTVSGAAAKDQIGSGGIQLADVTADGVLDVVADTPLANGGGKFDVGAIYVWKGCSTLSGSVSPLATLTVAGAVTLDHLGSASGQGVLFADVTGDGTIDVVAGTGDANVAGKQDVGAIYVWQGGSTLSGSLSPLATMTVPLAVAGDQLGIAGGQGIHLADVTGDGVLDVVGSAQFADVAGVVNVGAIYEWAGGSTLVGAPPLLQTMTVPGATAGDWLGY